MSIKEKLAYGAGVAASVGYAAIGVCQAAADTDLTNAMASTSAVATDNKSTILTYMVTIFLVVLVIAVAKAAMNWGLRKISGAFGGRRRR